MGGNDAGRGRLDGKVAIITGGAQGMGECAAELFAREGARVAVVDRSMGCQTVADRIVADGREAIWSNTDVTDANAIARMVDDVMARFGRIDVLYNNAGIGPPEDAILHELDEAVFDRVMDINVRGMFLVSKAVLPAMLARRGRQSGGSIINTASIAGLIGNSTVPASAYTVSKGAVMALTKQIAVSYADRRIRCNAVCPGPIETPILTPFFAQPGVRRRFEKRIPIGRIGQPIDVANLALFLASDESSFITGTLMVIDGGVTAQ
jgi:NAD(P)-dependent dehydrogenase (short-subunit alcohol dehydrogenase family)